MKCSVCNGRGYFPVSNISAKVCPQCNGTGEMQMTNEEWFCQLSAEEKAKFIADNDGTIQIGDEVDYKNTIIRWVEWLKEIHGESE